MAFKSGFFNSINLDRGYNNQDISRIFDGIINDGVYASEGNMLTVKAGGGMIVNVDTGRAWFNHTWSYNDSLYPLSIDPAHISLNRIDAVVLEVNHKVDTRRNSIKVLKGEPSINPVKPELTKNDENEIYQYPLGYISIAAGATTISQADIENAVGTEDCPFVDGIIKTSDIDNLISQWKAQWTDWFEKERTAALTEFDAFISTIEVLMDEDAVLRLQNEINHIYEMFGRINRSETAERDYNAGKLIIWNDKLYLTTAAVSQGDEFVEGENIESASFIDYLDKTNKFGIFYISKNNWSTSTIETSKGEKLYYNTIQVNRFYNPSGVFNVCGATSSVNDLPTEYERAAASLVVYCEGDDETNTITCYAKSVPSYSFYLSFEGVE